MTNYEKYKNEIIESLLNRDPCRFIGEYWGKEHCWRRMDPNDVGTSITCVDCLKGFNKWLNEEHKMYELGCKEVKAPAESINHSHWIYKELYEDIDNRNFSGYVCSECKEDFDKDLFDTYEFNYCPKCGTKMEGIK